MKKLIVCLTVSWTLPAWAGQSVALLDQTRFTATHISFGPCAPLTAGDAAVGFDPFDSNVFSTQECSIGWSGTAGAQESTVTAGTITASGNAFTKTNGGGSGDADISGESYCEVLFAVFEPVDYHLTGDLGGSGFGNPVEAVLLSAQVQLTTLGDLPLLYRDLSTPGPFDVSGTLVPGEYLLTALAKVSIDTNPVPSLVVGDVMFDVQLNLTAGCVEAAPCNDANGDAVRDDNCQFASCSGGACALTAIPFADMGGSFGACPSDGFANVHDRNHVLTCFSGTNSCDAINHDAGGPFGGCAADGFCNIHDANHALAAFAGTTTCVCPGGPQPAFDPIVAGSADLQVRAARERIAPGDTVTADVWIHGAVDALRSYQLELQVGGGTRGQLAVVDLIVTPRRSAAFAGQPDVFTAANPSAAQILAGLEADSGVHITDRATLATVVLQASRDAAGSFVIDVATGPQDQTALIAPGDAMIAIGAVTPAVITVDGRLRR